jgi:hypothetical protein
MPDPFSSPETYQAFILFPHPKDPSLAVTDPHHKHIPPDVKRHRIPAPELSFTKPNLPFLIQEIAQLLAE